MTDKLWAYTDIFKLWPPEGAQQSLYMSFTNSEDKEGAQRVLYTPLPHTDTSKSSPNMTLSLWPQVATMTSFIWRVCSTDLIMVRQRGRRVLLFWRWNSSAISLNTLYHNKRPLSAAALAFRSISALSTGFCQPASKSWNSPVALYLRHLGFPSQHDHPSSQGKPTNTRIHMKIKLGSCSRDSFCRWCEAICSAVVVTPHNHDLCDIIDLLQ